MVNPVTVDKVVAKAITQPCWNSVLAQDGTGKQRKITTAPDEPMLKGARFAQRAAVQFEHSTQHPFHAAGVDLAHALFWRTVAVNVLSGHIVIDQALYDTRDAWIIG